MHYKQDIVQALDLCAALIKRNLPEFTDRFQNAYSENGFYKPVENTDWTNGFWTGELWLAYEHTGDAAFRKAAEVQVESFANRIAQKISVDHHDMGFLYTPSCVAACQLTGNRTARAAALLAADQLRARYHAKGEFLQAWGSMNQPENHRLIIDCLMNVPLLYWAAGETGDASYREIAEKHTATCLANCVREDASTWHTFYFDPESGKPLRGATCQGYSDGSAWARGQAWGIYGSALAYRYTGRAEYCSSFRRVTEYFLSHLPEDLVPCWDLSFGEGSSEPRDSSSASIAACGMLEMAEHLPEEEAEGYRKTARRMLESLMQNYAVCDPKQSNGLVAHSTYSKHSPYNTCNHYGVDECNLWGDYFYMEALTRLKGTWDSYW